MNSRFPQRPEAHRLEEASRRFFVRCLPASWVAQTTENDYGVDLRVDIFEGDDATGLELLIQLKASRRAATEDTESITLQTATYNMLRDKLQVVMLVKYSLDEDEAYWLLLKDSPEPREGRDSVAVRIPKVNRLSQIDWDSIRDHVRDVTDFKLAAMRRRTLEAQR